ncbi:spermidine/putrescine ABC transporter substrate-binding protein [Actinomadura logoneensis]|uniref:Spermidine/putrescine ABC transporter substrate-binding protein n=1 Tax=Actinomadura logoneensis TaxID=2293572 RepID=A0A372JR43_9ACTN|nr:spermidine/putrescine ABC transporter substrate-binding protein [Actinomadura logoneensis]RFU42419.1 spermidine/putrescine ABC transporter substrate-binding protein [Actinomadura logoneensis]
MRGRPRPAPDPALLRGLTTRRGFLGAVGAVAGAAALSGCGIPGRGGNGVVTQADIDAYWRGRTGKGHVNWANWPGYMEDDHSTIKQFSKETGISVTYKEAIQEAADWFGKIQAPLAANQSIGFDLMVVTNGIQFTQLVELGYLAPLDHRRLPNFARYASEKAKRRAYDPQNVFSVPYMSGLTGIAYNTRYVKEPITSVQQLFDPKYKGRVGMMSDSQELGNFGMFAVGADPEKSTEADWKRAGEVLRGQRDKGIVRKYYEQGYIDAVTKGDVWLTMAWSGDVYTLSSPDVKFVVPKEGGTIWSDCMMLPKTAANPVDAIRLMDWLYEPRNNAPLTEFINYVTPVPGVQDVIRRQAAAATGKDKADLDRLATSPLIFPSAEEYAKLRTYRALSNAELPRYQKVFQTIPQGA